MPATDLSAATKPGTRRKMTLGALGTCHLVTLPTSQSAFPGGVLVTLYADITPTALLSTDVALPAEGAAYAGTDMFPIPAGQPVNIDCPTPGTPASIVLVAQTANQVVYIDIARIPVTR